MMKTLLSIAFAFSIFFQSTAQVLDPTFQAAITTTSIPEGAILLADGKYILYGGFTQANGGTGEGIVRFHANGTIDNTFTTGAGPNNSVLAGIQQPDGKILIAGRFSTYNGTLRTALARLNADGTLDPTFETRITLNSGGVSFNLALQPDGKVLMTAPFSTVDGTLVTSTLLRFNPDGSRDPSFSVTGLQSIQDIDLQSDGKIILGGFFSKGIARVNSNGSIDNTFDVGLGFNSVVYDVQVMAGDKIAAGGGFTSFNGLTNTSYLVRLNADGSLDTGFAANGMVNNTIFSLFLQPDGQLLVAGFFNNFNALFRESPIRLSNAGVLDATLAIGTGPDSQTLLFVTSNAAGDILVIAQLMTNFNGQPRKDVAILTNTGTVKPQTQALNLETAAEGRSVVLQGTDKILLGHLGTQINGTPNSGFARLNLNGSIDATFSGNSKPNRAVRSIALDGVGNILIGGDFTTYDGAPSNRFARLSPSGVRDAAFTTNGGSGFDSQVETIVVQPDGKILVGGLFSSFNSVARVGILRLNSDGSLDNTFNAANGFSTATGGVLVKVIERQPDGKIVVGGEFNGFGGTSVKSIIRLNSDGTLDNSFLIGTGASRSGSAASGVYGISLLTNGKMLIGGSFETVNAIPRGYFALLNADGTIDPSLPDRGVFIVDAIQKTPLGKFLVSSRNQGVFQMNSDGSFDDSFTRIPTSANPLDFEWINTNLILTGSVFFAQGNRVPGIAQLVFPTAGAPTNLQVSFVTSNSVALTWDDASSNETGFEVYRSVSNGQLTLLQTLPANTTTFTNTGLMPFSRYSYQIRAVIAGTATAFSNKISQTTLPTLWRTVNSSIPPRADGVAVEVNGRAYIGLGRNGTGRLKDWWEFNPTGNVWTQRADFPGTARIGAVAFAANGKVYVGTGNDGSGSGFRRDFYEFDPITNVWTARADFPEDPNALAGTTAGVAFSIGNQGYVGLGNTGLSNTKAFHKFNPGTNTWEAITPFGGVGRTGAIAFVSGGRAYVGYGFGGLGPNRNDLWEYNPGANTWEARASGSGTGRGGAAATVVNGVGYVFGGIENTSGSFSGPDVYTNSNFSYSISKNSWVSATPIPGQVRTDPMSFTLGNMVYLFGGYRFSGGDIFLSDFYSFTPEVSFFPSAPSNLVAAFLTTQSLLCSWVDNSTNEDGFVLEFSVGANGPFTFLAQLPAGTTTFLHSGLTPNTQYRYRVRTFNEFQSSVFSNVASVFTTTPPLAPSGLLAEALTPTSTQLTWTDNSNLETGFEVLRSEGTDQNLMVIQALAANTVTFTDSNVVPGILYFYRVRAVNQGGPSSSTPPADVPIAPANLAVQSFTNAQIVLTWADNASTETGFHIFRSTGNNSNFQFMQSVDANATSATLTGLAAGTTYFFKVRAVTPNGRSLFTNEVSQATLPNPPAVPSGLAAQSVTASQAVLTWTDNSVNETSFELQRSLQSITGFATIQTLAANTVTFTDTGLDPNTNYFYRIRATNAGGSSPFSTTATVTTLPLPPAAPTGLVVRVVSDSQIALTWADNSTDETGFEIQRSVNPDNPFVVIQTTAANVTSFNNTVLVAGTNYFYRVRAINTGGPSAFTNVVNTVVTNVSELATSGGLLAYPNPTADVLVIKNTSNRAKKYSVYDALGRLVVQDECGAEREQNLNCRDWARGTYLIRVFGESSTLRIYKH